MAANLNTSGKNVTDMQEKIAVYKPVQLISVVSTVYAPVSHVIFCFVIAKL